MGFSKTTGADDGASAYRRYLLGSLAYWLCAFEVIAAVSSFAGGHPGRSKTISDAGAAGSAGLALAITIYLLLLRAIDRRNHETQHNVATSHFTMVARYGFYTALYWILISNPLILIYYVAGHCNMPYPSRAACVVQAEWIGYAVLGMATFGYLALLRRVRQTMNVKRLNAADWPARRGT